ncbi:MAG TPA: ABC transporter permease [Candidatus Limnocylindrales bacterium]|nr:ABC transporter permease [Candidatus Limnocylindrales bacterium]
MTAVGHVLEHRARTYRRTFRSSVFTSFLSPILFLTAMGVGLGGYVDRAGGAALGGLTYLQFLAPGLLAATVMQSAAFEATFPIIGGLNWQRTFHAMYATPLSPRDIALGNLAWMAIRIAMIATVFTIVIVAFGAAHSPLVVLGIPVAVLTGMSFAAPIAAFSATQRTPNRFNVIFRFGITPLFLFSGTFFPIESLPGFLQPIAWLSPLWHGVDLTRGLVLDTLGEHPTLMLAHLVVLTTIVTVATWATVVTIERRLVRG